MKRGFSLGGHSGSVNGRKFKNNGIEDEPLESYASLMSPAQAKYEIDERRSEGLHLNLRGP
jgi:hypothetical protein